MSANEKVEDIVAELRRIASDGKVLNPRWVRRFADRIDAAYKRELESVRSEEKRLRGEVTAVGMDGAIEASVLNGQIRKRDERVRNLATALRFVNDALEAVGFKPMAENDPLARAVLAGRKVLKEVE